MTHTGIKDAERFLATIFEMGDIINFRFIPEGNTYATAGTPEVVSALDALRNKPIRCMPWFGANPRKAFGCADAAGTLLARCVFADFDDTDPTDAAARIKDSLLPYPTAIVKTNTGVHAWWRLQKPMYDLGEWTRLQARIAAELNSDPSVTDAPRIMRLPTFKDRFQDIESQLIYCNSDPKNFYEIEEFQLAESFQEIDSEMDSDYALAKLNGKTEIEKMGDRTRAFLKDGFLVPNKHGQPGSRRVAMYRAACDLAARGWKYEDAEDAILTRMESYEDLTEADIADCPRQIKRAFAAADVVPDPSRFDPLQGVIEVKPEVLPEVLPETSTVWLVENETFALDLASLVVPDIATHDLSKIFPRKTVYVALEGDDLLRATQRLVGIGCRVLSVSLHKLATATNPNAIQKIREVAKFSPLVKSRREQMDDTLQDLKGTQGLACLGIPTPGFPTMSARVFGWRGLILMGASPGVGKTTLALAAGLDALRNDPQTAFVVFSAEMSREVLRERLLATLARVPDRLLSVGDLSERADPATGLHLNRDDLGRVYAARELLASFGNRLCILDRREIPRMNRDTGYALQNMVEQTLAASNTSRAFVVLDPFQGVPFDSPTGQEWRQDLERDRGLMDFLLQTQRNIGEKFPFVVVSEATKSSWAEGAKMNDLLGSGRLAYSADAVLTVQPVELPEDLEDSERMGWLDIDPEHEDDRIERKLLRVSMVKGRDKMRRGDTWFVFEPAFQTIREHREQAMVSGFVAAEETKRKKAKARATSKNFKVKT